MRSHEVGGRDGTQGMCPRTSGAGADLLGIRPRGSTGGDDGYGTIGIAVVRRPDTCRIAGFLN